MRLTLCVLAVLSHAALCEAALFSGPAVFSVTPTSQLGTVTNNLIVTSTANGFVVSGQLVVNVPAGPQGGILATWTVDRPLDPAYAGPFSLTTTTVLDGFSAPPIPGTYQTTAGSVASSFSNVGGPSQSLVPMTLVNGIDNPPWILLSNTSSVFTYTPGVGNVLQQTFVLDGVQLSGPGGNWIIDVPVTTSVNPVPEPGGLALLALGAVLTLPSVLAARRRYFVRSDRSRTH